MVDIMGYWYLPGNEDKKIAGTLTYIPNGNITLRLFDSFYEPVESLDLALSALPITIWGISSKDEPITLLDCYIKNFNLQNPSSFNLISYQANYCVIGKHLFNNEDILGCNVRVDFDKLTYWCPPTLWDTEDVIDGKNQHYYTQIRYPINDSEPTKLTQVEINDNLTLALRVRTNTNYTIKSIHIDQETVLDLKYMSSVSLKQILTDIHLFNQFLVIATMQDVTTTNICVASEESLNDIKIYFVTPPSNECIENEFLFDDPRIDENFPDIIRTWYHTNQDFEPIKDYLIDILRRKDYSLSGFLQIVQAIDGYWQRFKDEDYKKQKKEQKKEEKKETKNNKQKKEKEVSFKTELEQLVKSFNGVTIITDIKWNYEKITDTRHHYSHLLKDGKKKDVIKDNKELRTTTKNLSALLVCCILEHLEIDKMSIGNSLTNAASKFLCS